MDPLIIDLHLTAKIVRNYVQHNTVGTGQLSDLITSVHRALAQLGTPDQPDEVLVPAVSVRRSVNHNEVVCMECGYRGKTLRRHISTRHGFSRDEYLKRWRLPNDHLLIAPAYSERRSTLSKEFGLGRKPAAQVARVTTTTPAPADADGKSETKPTRRGRPRSGSKSGGLREGASEQRRPRQRRPPSQGASPPQENSSSTVES